jgi:hypothetical protein
MEDIELRRESGVGAASESEQFALRIRLTAYSIGKSNSPVDCLAGRTAKGEAVAPLVMEKYKILTEIKLWKTTLSSKLIAPNLNVTITTT